jgi:hypothetical protein
LFVAATYILTVLTVWLVVAIASRQHHLVSEGVATFRYPALYRYLFSVMLAVFLAAGMYTVEWHPLRRATQWENAISVTISTAFCATCLYGYWLARRYRIVVSGRSIVVHKTFNVVEFTFDQIHSISVLRGYRGASDLHVFDSEGKVLLSVGGTIEDFEELVRLIRSKCRGRAVVFRERDTFGRWH